jgi:hypothetical protein
MDRISHSVPAHRRVYSRRRLWERRAYLGRHHEACRQKWWLRQAAVAVIVGGVLQLSGFEPNVDQTPNTQLAIRGCPSRLPGLTFVLGALLLGGFKDVASGPPI